MRDLKYIGVRSKTPPNFKTRNRAPLSTDISGVYRGDIWHEADTENIWMLTSKYNNIAIWSQLSNSGGSASFTDITITTGDLTLEDGDIIIESGGIVIEAINYISTLKTLGDGTIYGLPDGNDLEVYMGSTGVSAEFGALTSTGATVTITRTATGINFEAAGGTAAGTFTASDGNSVVPTLGGNLNILGGTNVNTTAAIDNTVTIDLDDTISLTDLTLTGDLTVNVDSHLVGDVLIDGDFAISSLTEGVLLSDGSGDITSSAGTDGYVLTSNGAGAVPTWQASGGGSGTVAELSSKAPTTWSLVKGTYSGSDGSVIITKAEYDESSDTVMKFYRGSYTINDSGDFLNWTDRNPTIPTGDSIISSMAYGNGYTILSLYAYSNYVHQEWVYSSDDFGVTWNSTQLNTDRRSNGYLAYNSGTFAFCSHDELSTYSGDIYYSTAAPYTSWTLITGIFGYNIYGLKYRNGYWVAVGKDTVSGNYYVKYCSTLTGTWLTGYSPGTTTYFEIDYLNGYWITNTGAYIYSATPTGSVTATKITMGGQKTIRVLNDLAFVGYPNESTGKALVCCTNDPSKFWHCPGASYVSTGSVKMRGIPYIYCRGVYFGNAVDGSEDYPPVLTIGIPGI